MRRQSQTSTTSQNEEEKENENDFEGHESLFKYESNDGSRKCESTAQSSTTHNVNRL